MQKSVLTLHKVLSRYSIVRLQLKLLYAQRYGLHIGIGINGGVGEGSGDLGARDSLGGVDGVDGVGCGDGVEGGEVFAGDS